MDIGKANWQMSRDVLAENLLQYWTLLTGKYFDDVGLMHKFFVEIETAYNSPGRYYHTLSHIDSLLNLTDQYQSHLNDKEIVTFAIFYHDIIYDVSQPDNEERSAVIAEDRLSALNLPQEKVDRIVQYIIASKKHELNEADRETDLAWFLDFDMSILGADWTVYFQYSRDVRKEYIIYPDDVYGAGRSQFLQCVLSRPFIFNTHQFRVNFEQQARLNIEKELRTLQFDA